MDEWAVPLGSVHSDEELPHAMDDALPLRRGDKVLCPREVSWQFNHPFHSSAMIWIS